MQTWPDRIVERLAGYLRATLGPAPVVAVPALPDSAEAALAWALARTLDRTVVLIADGPQSLETRHADAQCQRPSSGARLLYYPPCEDLMSGRPERDPGIAGSRLDTLGTLSDPDPGPGAVPPAERLIATCVQALLQTTVPPGILRQHTLRLRRNDDLEPDAVMDRLARAGYRDESEVSEPGQMSMKGGLLDVWPPTEDWPIRVEFFGSVIESLRDFDPADQRSRSRLEAVRLPPAGESALAGIGPAGRVPVLDYIPAGAAFLWSGPDSIREHAAVYAESAAEAGIAPPPLSFREVRALVDGRGQARQFLVGAAAEDGGAPALPLDLAPLAGVFPLPGEALQPDVVEQARAGLMRQLREKSRAGHTVVFFFDTPASLEQFRQHIEPQAAGGDAGPELNAQVGALSAGFASEPLRLTVVTEPDLYGHRKRSGRRYDPRPERRRSSRSAGARVSDIAELEPGDLVVHAEHGLGRYLGLSQLVLNGEGQEVLTIEYDGGAKLRVPVFHAHLLSRYVGVARHAARLHRLGGRRWQREKTAAEAAIADMAASLLETQAKRNLMPGAACPPDTPWQREFEGAFPYRETPDQQTVIEAVKRHMESPRPMDLVVCGDAGYGKTEVAMRAAFKAVMAQKQVAVLVPTTVLAQQHMETFSERMAPYPIRIEMLSRFCSARRRSDVLRGVASGAVDVVIGTHALIQPGVIFQDLGLAIIDEEQRFGVEHKEKLKRLRELVDVLTLTATPIPRTLYMSMTGARDMALLQTPPTERLAVETRVERNTDPVLREAILRELSREGQTYYLHNRVRTIDRVKARLAGLVPEARIEVAHGQMPSAELASVMRRFAAGAFDVLLCTTIIESGLDIPRANTILIDRADRFGIADLYQLRGRVGRSTHKAYAYLLLPPHGPVDHDAHKRISAVRAHSNLSAGFRLALKDLEIRGAGNLLGAAQSGHIAAVGFSLYCQLLRRTVARLKGETPPRVVDVEIRLDFLDLSPSAAGTERAAFIPYDYVEDERLRLGVYRRMAEAGQREDIRDLKEELRDRFGRIPPPVERLLRVAELRIACAERGISRVEIRDDKVILARGGDYLMDGARFPRLQTAAPDERLVEIEALVRTSDRWNAAREPRRARFTA